MSAHAFAFSVECDTAEQASTVYSERLGYDEDYGFDYTIVAAPAVELDPMAKAELALLRGYVDDVATLRPAAIVALLRFAGHTNSADILEAAHEAEAGHRQAELDGPRDSVFV